jgi:hypothetical protein
MTSAGDYTVLRSIIGNYSYHGSSAWTTSHPIVTTNETASTAVGTGSLIANGGASFAGDVYVGGTIYGGNISAGGGGTASKYDNYTLISSVSGVYSVSAKISTAGSYLGLPNVASNVSTAGSYLGLPNVASNVSTAGSLLAQTATQGQYLVKTGTATYGWSTIVTSGGGPGLLNIQYGITTIPGTGNIRINLSPTYSAVSVTGTYNFPGGLITTGVSSISAIPQSGTTINYFDFYAQPGYKVNWISVGI